MKHEWRELSRIGRGLWRTPGYTAVVVLALALGIGASSSIFALINALVLRPLPVSQPERLVGFGDPSLVRTVSAGVVRTDVFSYPLYTRIRDRARSVAGLFASGPAGPLDVLIPEGSVGVGASAEAEQPRGRLVSGNYFSVLGVRAGRGRLLSASDDAAAGAGPVAVISHDYWQRRFGGDAGVVGREVIVNRTPLRIVGVAEPGFEGEIVGVSTEIWIPLTMQPLLMGNQDRLREPKVNWLLLMGRLAPGSSLERARAEVDAIGRQAIAELAAADPAAGQPARIQAFSAARGFSAVRAELGGALTLLLALAGIILLVVCANVANLMLARTAGRRLELAVRVAVGAGWPSVVRYLLAESLLLGAMAGGLALAVVAAARAALLRNGSLAVRGMNLDLTIDARVIAFTVLLSLTASLALGLIPALRVTGLDLAATLRSHARGMKGGALGGGGRRLGLGQWLVVAQVSAALALLAGTGLLYRSVQNLSEVDVGYARDRLLVVQVDAQRAGYEGARLSALRTQIGERLRRLPGVTSVTHSEMGLFSGRFLELTLQAPGFTARTSRDTSAHADYVGPGYFGTLGARMLRGRDIEPRDAQGPRVAVLNETMARFYFAGRDPVGQYLSIENARYEVVGVARDLVSDDPHAAAPRRLYLPIEQEPASPSVFFIVRTSGAPEALAGAVRREITAADPGLRVFAPQTAAALLGRLTANDRIVALLAAGAGVLTLLLCVLGLYGVMSYTIARRTSEFGLRMALGARSLDITRMILWEALMLVGYGVVLGVPLALGASSLLRGRLTGVGLIDPVSLAAALALLGASALLAGYLPASRAARVGPQVALNRD